MSTLIILLLCGAAGGFIFEWFGLPGGAMTGAIIAVILLKSFSSLPQAAFPRPFQFCIYAGLGVLVGNMYRPEMLLAVRDTWPVLGCSSPFSSSNSATSTSPAPISPPAPAA